MRSRLQKERNLTLETVQNPLFFIFYSWENIFSQLDKSNGVSLKINFSRAFCPISGRFLQELCPKCCARRN